jgi:hypothetical protein
MVYRKAVVPMLCLLALTLHYFCSSPSKPNFDIPLEITFALFSDAACTDTLKQGSTFLCEQTGYFTLKVDMPHEITFTSLILKDSTGTNLFSDTNTSILGTDSIIPLDSFKLAYPGTDTITVTVTSVDTSVGVSFTVTVAGLPPVLGNSDSLQAGGIISNFLC